MQQDELYMHRCIELAGKGLGQVAPNPMVGCVIVHNNKIIGEGFHEKFGESHAEVNAIASVKDTSLLPYSTLYVNLEPCSHHGKTPPCSDLILKKRIKRVVVGSYDPNPLVNGKGIRKLADAGVEVTTEVLKKDCEYLNRRFITSHLHHRPYIILKWAESIDGYIAPDENRQVWLTGDEAKKLSHQWRSEEQSILTGTNTVKIDNPQLTTRLVQGNNPVRITMDKNLELSKNLHLFDNTAYTVIFNGLKNELAGNTKYICIDFSKNIIPQILLVLYKLNIQSVIVEGGATTLNHFIESDIWDEARIFTSNTKLNSGKRVNHPKGHSTFTQAVGNDKLTLIYK